MFPVGTKIISCEFSSERNYTAELRSKCKSKEEFKLWLTDFQNITGTSYRVLSTIPRTGQRVLYKVSHLVNIFLLNYIRDIQIRV